MSVQDSRQDPIVPLGYISGVHGIQGWVKVHSWTDPREAILDYQPWLVGEERTPVRIRAGRRSGKTVIVALPDVDDREKALDLVRKEIAVRRSQLPGLPKGEFYWTDLEGLLVVTTGGLELGRIARMMETGAHDVMVVEGEGQMLIPFVPGRYVKRVDLETGCVEVDWDPDF